MMEKIEFSNKYLHFLKCRLFNLPQRDAYCIEWEAKREWTTVSCDTSFGIERTILFHLMSKCFKKNGFTETFQPLQRFVYPFVQLIKMNWLS